jgi:hypothetical protein
MRFLLSDSLPTLLLTFPGGDSNEYSVRQGCVEFRANRGAWRAWRALDEPTNRICSFTLCSTLKSQSGCKREKPIRAKAVSNSAVFILWRSHLTLAVPYLGLVRGHLR